MSCLRPAHIYCLDKSTASLLLVIRPSIWTSLKLAKNISALNLSGTYQSSQEGVRASSLAVQRPPVASRTTWTLLPTPPQDQRPCRMWGVVCAAGTRPQASRLRAGGTTPPATTHLCGRLWAGGGPTDGPVLAGRAAGGHALASRRPSLDVSYPVLLRDAPSLGLGTHPPAGPPSTVLGAAFSPHQPPGPSLCSGVFNPSSCASVSMVT